MRVSGFMVPADKVICCDPKDTISQVMGVLLEHRIGAVIVLQSGVPVGIVTKTNFLEAYRDNVALDQAVEGIMSKQLETCVDTMSRDQAAHVLERNKNHHVIVLNKTGGFEGLISAWDIAVECAKDDRAWPWNRSEDGVFHNPNEKSVAT